MRPIGFLTITDSFGNVRRTTVTANEHGLLYINTGASALVNDYVETRLPFSVAHGGGTNTKIMEAIKAAARPTNTVEVYIEPDPK